MRPAHQRVEVGAGDPRMADVADDRDPCPSSEPSASRSVSASRSAWVGWACEPSPAFTIRSRQAAGRQIRSAAHRVAQDHRGDAGPLERAQRVDQRLALRHAADVDRELDDLRPEGLGGELEAAPGCGSRARRRPAPPPRHAAGRGFAAKAALAHLDRQVEDTLPAGRGSAGRRRGGVDEPRSETASASRDGHVGRPRGRGRILLGPGDHDLINAHRAGGRGRPRRGWKVLAHVIGPDRNRAMAAVDHSS